MFNVQSSQVSMFKVIFFGGASVPKTEPLPEVPNCVWCIQNPKPTSHVPSQLFPKPTSHVLRFRNRSLMFKVKIPNPTCKSHVQNQNSETHASFSMSKFRNPFLMFNGKIPKPMSPVQSQILSNFRGASVPKTEPLPEVQNIVWRAQNRKPMSHVQSQVSKTHVTFKAKSRFRNPRLMFKTKMFRVKIPKPRVSCSKSRCSKSRFRIPIASLMFTVKFLKPVSHLQSSSPEINWSGFE